MNSNHNRRLPTVLGAVGITAVLLAACSSSRSSTASTTDGGSTIPTSAPATTAPASVPPSTAAPATTTTVPVDMMLLRSDGIGSLNFGGRDTDVVAALAAVLGAPASDANDSYPTPNGAGAYLSLEGDVQFGSPLGRTVCFANSLCAYFGGPAAGSLTFVGYTYGDDPAAGMHTASGVTIGSRWSDFASMTVYEGGCYTAGTGMVDGVRLWVQSSGTPFTEIDGGGNWITHLPAPADVTVLSLDAGDYPLFLAGDC